MGLFKKKKQRLISKKKERTNPIINNRIVSDITFATRFRSFVYDFLPMDPIQEDEAEYLRMVETSSISKINCNRSRRIRLF